MSFSIRQANPKDVPQILQFIRDLAVFEKLENEVVATESLLSDYLFGEKKVASVIIGELAGQAVGMALYFYSFSTFLARPGVYLEDLYIKPEFRSRGFGAAMIRQLVRIAVAENCGRLEWSVLNWNERAIKFYRSLGAELLDGWTTCRLSGNKLRALAD